EMFRRLQQRLGGNAPDVGAGPARRGLAIGGAPCVDACDRHTQLSCANGSDIATGAGTDNDEVELFSHVLSRLNRVLTRARPSLAHWMEAAMQAARFPTTKEALKKTRPGLIVLGRRPAGSF